ncbi:hypothetical protein EJ04DRAFT_468829 [Polyplosphaeria fusca]|uniref:DNA-directed DNA polymerase n=1 Tax=Polyplosphaeria fusca TaxID=682080 RepID=A0A9P4QX71_9PLEO|nr:hypothetical protein EJ04DRAFT_468829 [Polyplosphaeria fusca]
MSDEELEAKIAFFKDQELLDISDDETDFPDEGYFMAERALADTKAMPPPNLARKNSSFLGPNPKERQAAFETHALKQRANRRYDAQGLTRSATDPESTAKKSTTTERSVTRTSNPMASPRKQLKRITSLPELTPHGKDESLFYKRMGMVPRELKSGKSAKPAEIRLEPEHRQLLREKIIYFYPNDDISMPRRVRIHKIIQLGAAWVTQWRDDITHVMVDDATYTYSQLLKHLNRAGLPRHVALVKFDPYVPQCIEFSTLLDPAASRFLVKGAPISTATARSRARSSSPSSQASLQVKLSRRQVAAQNSPGTQDSIGRTFSPMASSNIPDSSAEIVKDSFVRPSPDRPEQLQPYTARIGDALSQAIQEAKAISHLPLDEEDVDYGSENEKESENDTDEEHTKPIQKHTSKPKSPRSKGRKTKGMDQNAFQCMNPGTSLSSTTPNARTIQILEEMCKYYDQMQDQWRTLAYRKGITTLRKQPVKITTKEEAAALPFIGTRLAEKIEEIVLTDRLRKLDNTRGDPADKVLRLFLSIYGVGLSQANKWIQAGYFTLDDLAAKAKLTDNQKVGIAHYDDFAARIPRAEVEAHGAFVKDYLKKIDPGFEVTIMGSYRRGAKDSGDVDLIISKPGTSMSTMRAIVFGQLVSGLFAADFLKVSLATSHRLNDGSKWHGASCLPHSNTWRRLDLLLVPEEEMGAALLYFTGNDIFNRSMRLLASKKGMRLNQRGLYKDVIRSRNRERITEGTLVESRSEKRIFEILGVPWRAPAERIC